MKKVSNSELLERLRMKTNLLMKDALYKIERKDPDVEKIFHSKIVHQYLQEERVMECVYRPREVYLPLPKNEWPNRLKDLEKTYGSHVRWPQHSSYFCVADKLMSPEIPYMMYSGYAVHKDTLVPCSFFIVMEMTEQDCGDKKEMLPEIFVVDPLALRDGKQPECYIGIHIRRESMEEWYLSKPRPFSPLELEVDYLSGKLREEIRDNKEWDREIGNAVRSVLNDIPSGEERDNATKWIPGF